MIQGSELGFRPKCKNFVNFVLSADWVSSEQNFCEKVQNFAETFFCILQYYSESEHELCIRKQK